MKICRQTCVFRALALLFSVLYAGGQGMSQEEQDLILGRLRAIRNPSEHISAQDTSLRIGKCGLRLGFDVVRMWPLLTPQQKFQARSLLDPSQMQTDTVIGRFRIHFDTTNVNDNEPALLDSNQQRIPGSARAYVDSVGKYFNETWTYEIDSLGYNEPPLEAGQSYYNIYVRNLGSGVYGQTIFPGPPINPGQTPPRYTTYIEVHKDFQFFYSPGMAGLKVTAAHEFHHAIQLGSYGFWGNDIYFYEITSTWMEDVVYDDVNDYYQYIKTSMGLPRGHFATPDRSFNIDNAFIEYSRAIWGKYVEKKFSRGTMRRAWEYMRMEASLSALNRALNEQQSNLREAFTEFSLWNYFTSSRADTGSYYAEGRNYPPIALRDSLQYQRPLGVFSDRLESLGALYFRIYLNAARTASLTPIIVKTNVAEAGNGSAEQFQYIMRSDSQGDESLSGLQIQDSIYWVKVSGVQNIFDWTTVHVTDTMFVQPLATEVLVYPNPFYVPQQSWIRFQIPQDNISRAHLYIYSSSMELVFSEEQDSRTSLLKFPFFTWDGRTGDDEYAASGIYFYMLQAGNQEYTGKFIVIRR